MVQADDFGEVQQEAGVKGNDPKVAGNLRRRELFVMECHQYASEANKPHNPEDPCMEYLPTLGLF